jgi:hypothetical protein
LTCDFWAENGKRKSRSLRDGNEKKQIPAGWQQEKADPCGMATRKQRQNKGSRATAQWLVDGLHPTHRKVRDGWGTQVFVAWRKRRQKEKQISFGDDMQGQQREKKKGDGNPSVASPLELVTE